MNRVEAKRIFSNILLIIRNKDVSNFEKDYSGDLTCQINSEKLNLDDLRFRIANFIEHFEVLDITIKDFVYEDKKAAIRFYIKVKNKQDNEELEDHAFYFYKFKDNQVKDSWVLTKLPINNKHLSS